VGPYLLPFIPALHHTSFNSLHHILHLLLPSWFSIYHWWCLCVHHSVYPFAAFGLLPLQPWPAYLPLPHSSTTYVCLRTVLLPPTNMQQPSVLYLLLVPYLPHCSSSLFYRTFHHTHARSLHFFCTCLPAADVVSPRLLPATQLILPWLLFYQYAVYVVHYSIIILSMSLPYGTAWALPTPRLPGCSSSGAVLNLPAARYTAFHSCYGRIRLAYALGVAALRTLPGSASPPLPLPLGHITTHTAHNDTISSKPARTVDLPTSPTYDVSSTALVRTCRLCLFEQATFEAACRPQFPDLLRLGVDVLTTLPSTASLRPPFLRTYAVMDDELLKDDMPARHCRHALSRLTTRQHARTRTLRHS